MQLTWKWKTSRRLIVGFKYLWLKTVVGFNPEHHCFKCLIGRRITEFDPAMMTNRALEVDLKPGTIVYFCGVSKPYKWENNLHVAGIVTETDSVVETRVYNGDTLVVNNLEPIEISNSAVEKHYSDRDADYTTCRNFQFGSNLADLGFF